MTLIRKHLLGLLFIVASCPATSYALSCKLDPSKAAVFKEALGTALAVPADAPDGTIIWESAPHSLPVICADDYETGIREDVYFYVNPAKATIGKGIRVGIRYGSQTITQSSGAVTTGYNSLHGCSWANCAGWDKARFTLNFTVFIEKYGATPTDGQASTLGEYRVFQLDGKGGLNPKPNSNLNYVVTGMNNIRFVPCSPELTILPSVVNFRRALASSAQVGQVASSADFSLDLVRSCDTPYTVNARFTPVAGSASVIDKLLVPNNNSSVGIALTHQDSNQPVPFDSWFKLADLTVPGVVRNTFRADLIWRSAPIPGSFEAMALVDLYYK
ncbi:MULTISPECIES: fimbrial protein [unclassified Pseudomonas]|uniref:fimbrial protein n=1 Tax=unclassified Pseudomonas TaxID=196821 RepID=UPI00128ED7F4|nr:fimbrial protein [Pseudomonas sp. MN1F]MQG92660.1 fimbrial protein [Pseudomonas sp. MN1F]